MEEKDIAYLDGRIIDHGDRFNGPTLVFPAGILGEYCVSFNPDLDNAPWEYGWSRAEVQFMCELEFLADAESLDDAIKKLEEHCFVAVRNREVIQEYQKLVNKVNSDKLSFSFTHRDQGLSYNPSLTATNSKNELFYIVYEDSFIVGALSQDGASKIGASGEVEYVLTSMEGAENALLQEFGVMLTPGSQRERDNFLAFAKCMKAMPKS